MKGLKAIVVVVGLMLCFPVASFAEIVNSGAYNPTIYPDDEVTVWGDYYPDDLGDIIVGFVDDDQVNEYADVLFVNSTSNVQDMKAWYKNINANYNTDTIVVEAKLWLHNYTGSHTMGGCAIWVGNGTREEGLVINPDDVRLYAAGVTHEYVNIDPTDGYHVYKIEFSKDKIKVIIDEGEVGEEVAFDRTPASQWWQAENYIMFGDGSTGAGSIVTWAKVTYTVDDGQ